MQCRLLDFYVQITEAMENYVDEKIGEANYSTHAYVKQECVYRADGATRPWISLFSAEMFNASPEERARFERDMVRVRGKIASVVIRDER